MRVVGLMLLVAAAATSEEPEEWFSHRRHAALNLPCTYCHTTAAKAMRAGMPVAGRCLQCHAGMPETTPVLKRLRKLSPAARPFQAQYDNLPEYVIFSHARHARAKIACEVCHGKVAEQEQTQPANALNMKACVDCHQARGAKTACRLCHRVVEGGGAVH
jgi:Cytochrome c7 and related cytochrome c